MTVMTTSSSSNVKPLARPARFDRTELVALDLVVKRAFRDPEGARSSGHVAPVPVQGLFVGSALDLFERENLTGGRGVRPGTCAAGAAAGRLDRSRHALNQVLIRRRRLASPSMRLASSRTFSGPLVRLEVSHHGGRHIDRSASHAVGVLRR